MARRSCLHLDGEGATPPALHCRDKLRFHPKAIRMARDGAQYVCQSCGAVHAKWAGQCSACLAWNTLVEEVTSRAPGSLAPTRATKSRGLAFEGLEALSPPPPRIATGIAEFDRVCGGGVVPGSALLLAGDPRCRQVNPAAPGLRPGDAQRRRLRLHLRRGGGGADPRAGASHGPRRHPGPARRRDRVARHHGWAQARPVRSGGHRLDPDPVERRPRGGDPAR